MRYGKQLDGLHMVIGLRLAGYEILIDNGVPDRMFAVNDRERWLKMGEAQFNRLAKLLEAQ